MNRREFLLLIINKILKPLLLVLIIYFLFDFMYKAISDSGNERTVILLFFGIGLFFATLMLIGILFNSITTKIYSKLSDKSKFRLRILDKILKFVLPIIAGILIYYLWKEDWIKAVVTISFPLILAISAKIQTRKKEKN